MSFDFSTTLAVGVPARIWIHVIYVYVELSWHPFCFFRFYFSCGLLGRSSLLPCGTGWPAHRRQAVLFRRTMKLPITVPPHTYERDQEAVFGVDQDGVTRMAWIFDRDMIWPFVPHRPETLSTAPVNLNLVCLWRSQTSTLSTMHQKGTENVQL